MHYFLLFACILPLLHRAFAQMPNSTDIALTTFTADPAIIPGATIYVNASSSYDSIMVGNLFNESINAFVNSELVFADVAPGTWTEFKSCMLGDMGYNTFEARFLNGTMADGIPGIQVGGSGHFMNFTVGPNSQYDINANVNYNLVFTSPDKETTISRYCMNYGANSSPQFTCWMNEITQGSAIFPAGDCTMSLQVTMDDGTLIADLPFPTPVPFQSYFSNITAGDQDQIWDGSNFTIQGAFDPLDTYACGFVFRTPSLNPFYWSNTTFGSASSNNMQFSCSIPQDTSENVQEASDLIINILQKDASGNVVTLPQGNRLEFRFYYSKPQPSTSGSSSDSTGVPGKHGLSKKDISIIIGVVVGVAGTGIIVAAISVYYVIRKKNKEERGPLISRP